MKDTIRRISLRATLGLALSALLLASAACGDDPAAPSLNIALFGWGPDLTTGETGFVSGLPAYEGAQQIRISVTQPFDGRVLDSATFPVGAHSGTLPEVPFGENLRLEVEAFDASGKVLASGATPAFDFAAGQESRSLRVQVNPVGGFAPVGAVFEERSTGLRKFKPSDFDYRGTDKVWLGRIGHGVASTSDGKVLVVGGGDPKPGFAVGTLPEFRAIYDDVQIFDPQTGYFTDLSVDETGGATAGQGADRLFKPIAFPTVTPLGDDRFLVAGGFTLSDESLLPDTTLQIIDLRAEPGMRITKLLSTTGEIQALRKARGWHSATYRRADDTVIVAGGLGAGGSSDVLDTFEMINLSSGTVSEQPLNMLDARVEHSAVLMGDGTSVWLLGGRDGSGALASTEVIQLDENGNTFSKPEASLNQARFGHAGLRITTGANPLANPLALVVGGYTDLNGATTGRYEISGLGRGGFESKAAWSLQQARGRLQAVELNKSGDIAVIGGRDASSAYVRQAERLVFSGNVANDIPYAAEATGEAINDRYMATATLLSSGNIAIVGGIGRIDGSVAAHDDVDLYNAYDPIAPAPAATPVAGGDGGDGGGGGDGGDVVIVE